MPHRNTKTAIKILLATGATAGILSAALPVRASTAPQLQEEQLPATPAASTTQPYEEEMTTTTLHDRSVLGGYMVAFTLWSGVTGTVYIWRLLARASMSA